MPEPIIDSNGDEWDIDDIPEDDCPICGEPLDSGFFFPTRMRDLECDNCGWNISYPA